LPAGLQGMTWKTPPVRHRSEPAGSESPSCYSSTDKVSSYCPTPDSSDLSHSEALRPEPPFLLPKFPIQSSDWYIRHSRKGPDHSAPEAFLPVLFFLPAKGQLYFLCAVNARNAPAGYCPLSGHR